MKQHTKQKPAEVGLCIEHARELLDFVNHIANYAEEPANWPLTQQEQIAFVRTVIYQARKLRKSESYVVATLLLATKELAMAS